MLSQGSLHGATGVELTLGGIGGQHTITLNQNGILFTIDSGNTKLTLSENITLAGRSNNTAPLILVKNTGSLEMLPGSRIINNKNKNPVNYNGGGIHMDGGSFLMNGGEIYGNEAPRGGGIYAYRAQSFTMVTGTIEANYAQDDGGGIYFIDYVNNGFLNGGTIINNYAGTVDTGQGRGGGLYVQINNTLSLTGVSITRNLATRLTGEGGGGIHLKAGTIIFSGGALFDNYTTASGEATNSANLRRTGGTFQNLTGVAIPLTVPPVLF
jgi:hypothetical protein